MFVFFANFILDVKFWSYCNFVPVKMIMHLLFAGMADFKVFQKDFEILERLWNTWDIEILGWCPAGLVLPHRDIVYTRPPHFLLGGWTYYQIFKKGGEGTWQDLNFERGVAGKERATFFRGGCNFYKNNKLKSAIFNDKKSL